MGSELLKHKEVEKRLRTYEKSLTKLLRRLGLAANLEVKLRPRIRQVHIPAKAKPRKRSRDKVWEDRYAQKLKRRPLKAEEWDEIENALGPKAPALATVKALRANGNTPLDLDERHVIKLNAGLKQLPARGNLTSAFRQRGLDKKYAWSTHQGLHLRVRVQDEAKEK